MAIAPSLSRFRRAARMVVIQQRLAREMQSTRFELELEAAVPDDDGSFGGGGSERSAEGAESASDSAAGGRHLLRRLSTRKLQFTPSGKFVSSEHAEHDGGEGMGKGEGVRGERREGEGERRERGEEGREGVSSAADGKQTSKKWLKRSSGVRRLVGKDKRAAAVRVAKGIGHRVRNMMDTQMGQEKIIDASEDILESYHGSFLYGHIPLNMQIRAALRTGTFDFFHCLVEAILVIISVSIYIWRTYNPGDVPSELIAVTTTISMLLAVDFVIKIYTAPVRVKYLLSFYGVVDFLSTLPAILQVMGGRGGAIVQLFVFLRILRIVPLIKRLGVFSDAITLQVFTASFSVFIWVFVGAGVYQWAEFVGTSDSLKAELGCNPSGCITFFTSFYYLVVTVATVGYGDVHPTSNFGRLVAIVAIIAALTYIPMQINNIVQMASKRPYGGWLSWYNVVGTRYVVLWGASSLSTVREFLAAFFSPAHQESVAAYPLKLVVVGPFAPSFQLKSLVTLYGGSVSFIQGSLHRPEDFDRVCARNAAAFFLISNRYTEDPESEDTAQVVRSMVAARSCGPEVRILVEMLQARSMGSAAVWGGETKGLEVICTDPFRFKLLARSCFVKGLPPLITNLFRTGYTYNASKASDWMDEYLQGQAMEIFPLLFPPQFHGLLFEEAVEVLFRLHGIILFALDAELEAAPAASSLASSESASTSAAASGTAETGEAATRSEKSADDDDAVRQLFLFPSGRLIGPDDVGMVIASSLRVVERASKFSSAEKGRREEGARKDAKTEEHDGADEALKAEENAEGTVAGENNRKHPEVTSSENGRWGRKTEKFFDLGHLKKLMFGAETRAEREWRLMREAQGRWREARERVQLGRQQLLSAGDEEGVDGGRGGLVKKATLETSSSREWRWETSMEEERRMSQRLYEILSSSRGHLKPSPSAPQLRNDSVAEDLHTVTKMASMPEMKSHEQLQPENDRNYRNDQVLANGTSENGRILPPVPKKKSAPSLAPLPENLPENSPDAAEGSCGPHEASVDEFLDWPKSVHPAVLERCRAKIERHLASRTLAGAVFEKAHVLVTMQKDCWPKGFHRFVAALREEGLPSPPLVILRAERPSHMEWGSIGRFKDVFFIKGSPLYELDLVRAGILKSRKVVIMSSDLLQAHQSSMEEANDDENTAASVTDIDFEEDVINMIISANVDRLLKDPWDAQRVVCELQTERCFQYLRPKFLLHRSRLRKLEYERNPDALFRYTPSFCQGKAICPMSLQFILYGTFYNTNVMSLLDQLLDGGPINEETYLVNPGAKRPMPNGPPTYRLLHHRLVPKEMAGQTFKELFMFLLKKHELVIGLYRAKGTLQSPAPYVFTNPAPDTIVNENDFVYIIS